ncbi:MAG: hypothetical protein ACRD29_21310 [Acidimicrobiales bacterium]
MRLRRWSVLIGSFVARRHPTARRRRWPLILVLSILGAAAGAAWDSRLPRRYTSTTAVLLAPTSGYVDLDPANGAPPQVTIDTDARIALSDAVVERVAEETGSTRAQVRDASSLSAPPLSTVLRLSYTASTPRVATVGASTWADAALAERERVLAASSEQYRRVLEEEVRRVRNVLALGGFDPTTTISINEQVVRLETALQRLERQTSSGGRLLTAPGPPKRPNPTDPEVPVVSGMMLGTLAGVGLTTARSSRRNRKSTWDVHAAAVEGVLYRRPSLLRDTVGQRRPTIAAGALLGVLAGWMLTGVVADRQDATAALVLRSLPGNAYGQDPRRDQTQAMQNEVQSVRSDQVLGSAAALMRRTVTITDLQRRVRVTVPPRTTTVRITYGGADATTAAENAQHVLTAYIDYRAQRAQDAIQTRLEGLSGQISDVSAQLQQSLAIVATGSPNQQAYQRLLAVSLSQRLLNLETERMRVASLPTSAGTAVPPTVVRARGAASPLLIGGAGSLFGLVAGLAAAIVHERRADRLRHARDLEGNGIVVLAAEQPRGALSALDREDFARRAAGALLRRRRPPFRLALVAASPTIDTVGLADVLALGFVHLGRAAVVVDVQQRTARRTYIDASARPRLRAETRADIDGLLRGRAHPRRAVVIVACGSPTEADGTLLTAADLVAGVVVVHRSTHSDVESLRNQISQRGRSLDGVVALATADIGLRPVEEEAAAPVVAVSVRRAQ